jgi:hypothetical protein
MKAATPGGHGDRHCPFKGVQHLDDCGFGGVTHLRNYQLDAARSPAGKFAQKRGTEGLDLGGADDTSRSALSRFFSPVRLHLLKKLASC